MCKGSNLILTIILFLKKITLLTKCPSMIFLFVHLFSLIGRYQKGYEGLAGCLSRSVLKISCRHTGTVEAVSSWVSCPSAEGEDVCLRTACWMINKCPFSRGSCKGVLQRSCTCMDPDSIGRTGARCPAVS